MAVHAFLLAFVCVLLASTSAQSQETPLQFFPANTAFVARFHSPRQMQDQLLDTVESLDVGWSVMLGNMLENLGTYISNEELAGVDENVDWWMAVTLDANLDRDVIFAIPASDMSAMESGLYSENHFVSQGRWGIYTEGEETFQQIKEAISNKNGLGNSVPADVFFRQSEPGLQVVARVDYLKQLFPFLIDLYRANADNEIALLRSMPRPPTQDELNWKVQIEGEVVAMTTFRDSFIQFATDATLYGIMLNADKEKVRLIQSFHFQAGSPSSMKLSIGGDCLKPLANHPEADIYYCTIFDGLLAILRRATDVSRVQLAKVEGRMRVDDSSLDLTSDAADHVTAAKISSTAWSLSVNPSATDGYLQCLVSMRASAPNKLKEALRLIGDSIALDVKNKHLSGKISFQEKTIERHTVSVVDFELPPTPTAPPGLVRVIPDYKKWGSIFFGRGPALFQYVQNDDSVSIVIGNASRLLTPMAEKTSTSKPGLQFVKAEHSIFLFACDPASLSQNIALAMNHYAESNPNGDETIPWNKVDLPKSYVTLDMTTQNSAADLTLTIPVQTLKNGQKLMPQLLPLFMRNAMSPQPALGR